MLTLVLHSFCREVPKVSISDHNIYRDMRVCWRKEFRTRICTQRCNPFPQCLVSDVIHCCDITQVLYSRKVVTYGL